MKGQYTKLFLIGNGFDRWQGLPTSYGDFRQYYFAHILEITKELRIKTEVDDAGRLITPVEKIFGNIFNPEALPGEFFWNFESSMALLDDQNISLYFGKTDKGVYQMQETLNSALKILRKVFGDWIKSISIADKDTGYRFDDSCYFINFNYTNTLEKRFQVDERNVNYIHGDFSDTESIVFGHSTHPEMAFPELMEQKFIHRVGGDKSKRFRELYLVEDALYETDKEEVARIQKKTNDWEKTNKQLEKEFFTIDENIKYEMQKEGYRLEDLEKAEKLSVQTGKKAMELIRAKGKASDNRKWSDVVKKEELQAAEKTEVPK